MSKCTGGNNEFETAQAIVGQDAENEIGVSSVRRVDAFVRRFDELRTDHPYTATAIETVAVWAGREIMTKVVNDSGVVRIGHGWKNSRAGQVFSMPAVAIGAGLVASPWIEEWVCRKNPSNYLDKKGRTGLEPELGVAAAAIFAAGHLGKEAAPVPQFVGGLNYWRLQRTRGFGHAVLSHALHNGLAGLAATLYRRHELHRKIGSDVE